MSTHAHPPPRNSGGGVTADRARQAATAPWGPKSPAALLRLQRTAGNAAVQRLLGVQRCGPIPPERCPCRDDEHDMAEPGRTAGAGAPMQLQRKVDEGEFARTGGRIEEVGETTASGFAESTTDSNEFLLWNYQVGSAEPRAEHAAHLGKVLTPARWPDMLRGDPTLKVGVVGGASTTGGAAITTPLSVKRADRIKASLVSGGIDAKQVQTSGVGSRHPFADETSSENMARNRRVEVFLFRPTRRAASLPSGISVTATNLAAAVETGVDRDTSDPSVLVLRWKAFTFSADVMATGPVEVGILQFLRGDSRVGSYDGPGGAFVLDFGRCIQPDLPCKDVIEARGVFSGAARVTGPGSGTVSMRDRPGLVMPIVVSDPRRGRLASAHWFMEFVAVVGARLGDAFLPLKSVVWRLTDEHARDSTGQLNPASLTASADAPTDGAPADLAVEQAMSGRTCRFMVRRMRGFCRPEG